MVPKRTRPVSVTQTGVHIKCLLCVSSCTQNRNVATIFSKISIYEVSRKSVQYGQMTSRKDERADGQVVSLKDGRTNVEMASRSDGRTDRQVVSLKDGRTNGEMASRSDGRTDGRTDGRKDGQSVGRGNRQTSSLVVAIRLANASE